MDLQEAVSYIVNITRLRFCVLPEVPELCFICDVSGHRLGYSGYTCKGIFVFYYYCEAERKKGLGRFISDPSVDRFLSQRKERLRKFVSLPFFLYF